MKTFLITIILIICCLFCSIQAYCVYNNSEKKIIQLHQRSYHTNAAEVALFKTGEMNPGGKQCCPYTNTDCSTSGSKEERLLMDIFVLPTSHFAVSFPAGGWIEVKESPQEEYMVDFDVFNADGTPFEFMYVDKDTKELIAN